MDLDKSESIFFDVLEDLKDYLPDLTLVGGWVPYVYAKYIWKNVPNLAVSTSDIDFGWVIKNSREKIPSLLM